MGLIPGRANRPSILVTKDYNVYLGNMGSEELAVNAGELFGFGVGAFELRRYSGISITTSMPVTVFNCYPMESHVNFNDLKVRLV